VTKGVSFSFHAPRFKPVAGEAMTDYQLDALVEAEEASGNPNDDFIQVGTFGKELAAWVQQGLQSRGHSIAGNQADDWARVINVEAGNGKTVGLACTNQDSDVDHVIMIIPRKGVLSRLLGDKRYDAFVERLTGDLEDILRSDPGISKIEKEQ
jgi:hypothetical protein